MSTSALSERLRRLGRPIWPTGITKIEAGRVEDGEGVRRVDVDDLIALALALDVSPNRLLLPESATDEQIDLTPRTRASSLALWRWATGDEELRLDVGHKDPSVRLDLDRTERFRTENRPHDPMANVPFQRLIENEDVLRPVLEAVDAARERGLSLRAILDWVELATTWRRTLQDPTTPPTPAEGQAS
jgi:hypothetical protein